MNKNRRQRSFNSRSKSQNIDSPYRVTYISLNVSYENLLVHQVNDVSLYSLHLVYWQCIDIVRRNEIFIAISVLRYRESDIDRIPFSLELNIGRFFLRSPDRFPIFGEFHFLFSSSSSVRVDSWTSRLSFELNNAINSSELKEDVLTQIVNRSRKANYVYKMLKHEHIFSVILH